MPIVVQHQPDPRLIGQAAFAAGLGQYNQQQFQNGLQLTQLALQERARQQQQAAQQQAMQQAAQQAAMDREMQARELQARRQQGDQQFQQQIFLRQLDANADAQRQAAANQQQQQNYSDLRQHQMTMLRERNSFDAIKGDTEERVKQLGQIRSSGLTPEGIQAAEQLRRDLQTITSRRQMGQSDDTEYQAAMAEWDKRFNQYGDWSLMRRDPKQQMLQDLEASFVEHPEFGRVRIVRGRNGEIVPIPVEPQFRQGPDGQLYRGVFGADGTIDWEVAEQPKQEKPVAEKPSFTPKDVLSLADTMYQEYMNEEDPYGERTADILAGQEKTRQDFIQKAKEQFESLSPKAQQPSNQAPPQLQSPQRPVAPQTRQQMQAADADQAFLNEFESRLRQSGDAESIQKFDQWIKPSIAAGIPPSDPRLKPWFDRVAQKLQASTAAAQSPQAAQVMDMRKKMDPLMSPEQKVEWDATIQPLLDQGVDISDPRMVKAVQKLTAKIRSRLKPTR